MSEAVRRSRSTAAVASLILLSASSRVARLSATQGADIVVEEPDRHLPQPRLDRRDRPEPLLGPMILHANRGLSDNAHRARSEDDMGMVVLDISMSLDGFVAGPNVDVERPLG